jgi:hypothetical protein
VAAVPPKSWRSLAVAGALGAAGAGLALLPFAAAVPLGLGVTGLIYLRELGGARRSALAAGVAAYSELQRRRTDPEYLARVCFERVDWRSAPATLAALQIIEDLLWEFERTCERDDDLNDLPAERLRRYLATDRFTVDGSGRIHPPDTLYADHSLGSVTDSSVIRVLLVRIKAALPTDPMLAIGTAKELIEATSKTILKELGRPVPDKAELPELVMLAETAVSEHPACVPGGLDGAVEVKRLLGRFNALANDLAALRNRYGTGHGPAALPAGLRLRHGRLAIGAADTWCTYMLDALADYTNHQTPAITSTPPHRIVLAGPA